MIKEDEVELAAIDRCVILSSKAFSLGMQKDGPNAVSMAFSQGSRMPILP
jgi:hypothetical protein